MVPAWGFFHKQGRHMPDYFSRYEYCSHYWIGNLIGCALLIAGLGLPVQKAHAHQHDMMTAEQMYQALNWDFASAEVTVEKVGPSLYVLFGVGGNIAVSVGEDGVLIVDDQFPQMIPKVSAAIEGLGGEGVDYVVNSHWHFDHAEGNLVLGNKGASIISQTNSRVMNTQDQVINLVGIGRYKQEAYPAHALADITFDESMQLHFNGERVDLLHYGPAHTSGDAATVFRGNNAVHFGDVFNAGYPFIDVDNGGSLSGMIEFCSQVLAQISADTTVIPGHGPVSTYADLQSYIVMLTTVRDRIAALIAKGKSLQEVIEAAPTKEFDEQFGSPAQLLDRGYYSLGGKPAGGSG